MTWRLDVVHRTDFQYSGPVLSSYNEARMTPTTDLHQATVSSRFATTPGVPVRRYWDYWGTQVSAFDIHDAHDALSVTSASVVETEPPRSPAHQITWDELANDEVKDRYDELLRPTVYTDDDPELCELARGLVEKGADPADAALSVAKWVNQSLTYESGVTGVHTSAVQAWHEKRGVCQDFAHVALVQLRALGIPARYVSGYLHPSKEAPIGERVAGESHAWIEAWTGEWWGFDPTNDVEIGHRHVEVARGRDYSDVAPLTGVLSGGATADLTVEVTLTRLR